MLHLRRGLLQRGRRGFATATEAYDVVVIGGGKLANFIKMI